MTATISKKERILIALSNMPIAKTAQIAKLYHSNNSPLKKASQDLVDLEREKLIEWSWHQRGKIWRLTTKGHRRMMNGRMTCDNVEHALAVGDIYFTIHPSKWMYEPVEKFELGGKTMTWNPDCIFAHNGKLYCAEVQLSRLSEQQWKKKWSIFNWYFESAYKNAEFQNWSDKPGAKTPQFIAITTNKKAAEGFSIPQRELKVISSITELY